MRGCSSPLSTAMAVKVEIDFKDGNGPVRVRLQPGEQLEIYPQGLPNDEDERNRPKDDLDRK